jgi:hypothetical protein
MAAGGSTGCSAKDNQGVSADGSVVSPCPTTIQDTVGKPCPVEGMRCGPTYSCGPTDVPITCTCFGGTFACVDGSGNPFDGSTPPACNTPPSGASCPASESAANFAPCTEAQVGQPCAYPAQCTGGTSTFDLCTCQSAVDKSGAPALVFVCENSCSGGTGPLPEAGMPESDASSPHVDAEAGSVETGTEAGGEAAAD